jgi:hypothetical protein
MENSAESSKMRVGRDDVEGFLLKYDDVGGLWTHDVP